MELRPAAPDPREEEVEEPLPGRPEHLRTLYGLVVALGRATTYDEVCEAALEGLPAIGLSGRAAILTLDAAGAMRFRDWRGLSDDYRRGAEGLSPWGRATRDARPVILPDVRAGGGPAGAPELLATEGIGALAFFPLVHQGELLGQVTLAFAAPSPVLAPGDLELVEAVAHHVAAALVRTRAWQKADRAAARSARLQRLTASLARALTAAEVVAVLAREGVGAFEAAAGIVCLINELTGELHLVESVGYDPAAVEPFRRMPVSAAVPVAEAFRTRRLLLIASPAEMAARFPAAVVHRPLAPQRRAFAAVPLLLDDRALGVMGLSFDAARAFDDEDRELMETLASQCAQALERARLYEQEHLARQLAEAAQRRLAETNERQGLQLFLANVSRVLASSLDYEITLQSAARMLIPTLGDLCVVLIADGAGRLSQVAEASADPDVEASLRRLRGAPPAAADAGETAGVSSRASAFPLARQVLASGETAFIDEPPASFYDEIAAESAERAEIMRALAVRSLAVVPIRARGQVLGVMTFGVTGAGRRADRSLVLLAEELAERAGVAIDNARLFRETREAVRLRDDFMSVAGHELKTPLTALGLQVGALRRLMGPSGAAVPDGAKVRAKVEVMGRQIDRLGRLIDALLDVARMSAGRFQLQPEPFDLTALAEEVVGRFSEEVARGGSGIRVFAPGPLLGTWDRMRIDQVLTNLVANAVKYGRGKPIEVVLEARGADARIEVRDEGIGVPAQQQQRIFDRFERAVSSNNYGGLGLGLWIARQIVEAHGGRIGVDGRDGGGSCFTVDLPSVAAKPPPE